MACVGMRVTVTRKIAYSYMAAGVMHFRFLYYCTHVTSDKYQMNNAPNKMTRTAARRSRRVAVLSAHEERRSRRVVVVSTCEGRRSCRCLRCYMEGMSSEILVATEERVGVVHEACTFLELKVRQICSAKTIVYYLFAAY
ncbi:hypothetical protein NDU88_001822 [Pleurodeles waltl]|uniref:Uncharacterized protein n=1 Tax=Pleurodeles waltl TaxID=8319 RepID=A0AAV7NBU3_PLEWA|nr:hypothetical protein NDU88_001822 [Pleurodeles waltl]